MKLTFEIVHKKIKVVVFILEYDLRRPSASRRLELGFVQVENIVHVLTEHAIGDQTYMFAAFQQVEFAY